MAKSVRNERTSSDVASVAGRLLNGKNLREAEDWLHSIVMTDSAADDTDRAHALTLLGALSGMRTLAASALTQR